MTQIAGLSDSVICLQYFTTTTWDKHWKLLSSTKRALSAGPPAPPGSALALVQLLRTTGGDDIQ
jgi:hypothetical protein